MGSNSGVVKIRMVRRPFKHSKLQFLVVPSLPTEIKSAHRADFFVLAHYYFLLKLQFITYYPR